MGTICGTSVEEQASAKRLGSSKNQAQTNYLWPGKSCQKEGRWLGTTIMQCAFIRIDRHCRFLILVRASLC